MNAAQRSTSSTQPLSSSLPNRQSAGVPQSHQPLTNQPLVKRVPSGRGLYQPKRVPYAGARRAIAFESSVKLTVNLLLAIVATTTIAKLVPYYQAQQDRLATLEESVTVAERKNAELHQEFERNFDPAQTSRIMQEQSGLHYANQKKVIWAEPPATESPERESAK